MTIEAQQFARYLIQFQFILNCRYVLIGINLGYCLTSVPELYTSLLSTSVWKWIVNGVSSDLYAYDGDHVELSVCHDHRCGFDHQSECKATDPADRTPDTTQVSYFNVEKWFW